MTVGLAVGIEQGLQALLVIEIVQMNLDARDALAEAIESALDYALHPLRQIPTAAAAASCAVSRPSRTRQCPGRRSRGNSIGP